MYENNFLCAVGETILFMTVSGAWVDAVAVPNKKRKRQKDLEDNRFSREILNDSECLDFMIEYFNLNLDGDRVKNMFNYYLRKRLK